MKKEKYTSVMDKILREVLNCGYFDAEAIESVTYDLEKRLTGDERLSPDTSKTHGFLNAPTTSSETYHAGRVAAALEILTRDIAYRNITDSNEKQKKSSKLLSLCRETKLKLLNDFDIPVKKFAIAALIQIGRNLNDNNSPPYYYLSKLEESHDLHLQDTNKLTHVPEILGNCISLKNLKAQDHYFLKEEHVYKLLDSVIVGISFNTVKVISEQLKKTDNQEIKGLLKDLTDLTGRLVLDNQHRLIAEAKAEAKNMDKDWYKRVAEASKKSIISKKKLSEHPNILEKIDNIISTNDNKTMNEEQLSALSEVVNIIKPLSINPRAR